MIGWRKFRYFFLLLAISVGVVSCAAESEITSEYFLERLQGLVREDFGDLPDTTRTPDGQYTLQLTAHVSISWKAEPSSGVLQQASLALDKNGATTQDCDIYTYYIMTFIQAADQELTVASYNRLYDALQLSESENEIRTQIGVGARHYAYTVTSEARCLTVTFQETPETESEESLSET